MCPGMNVVLISRTQAKLDAAAEEIQAKHGVKTKTLAVDFAQANGETYARLKDELAPLQVPHPCMCFRTHRYLHLAPF